MSEYILSKYNRYYQDGNNLLVLGGTSRTVVQFENCSIKTLLNEIMMLSNEEIDYLHEYGIIIDFGVDEYDNYMSTFQRWKTNDKELTVTIGLTFNCNFNCQYCIQKGNYTEKSSISFEQADFIMKWIEDAFIAQHFKTLNLNYFGGEPTLNLETLFYISKQVAFFCEQNDIELYQQIVTNGYAVDEFTIKKFLELNIMDFQITLDGLADIHNDRRSRYFDSFSKIVNNVILLSELGMRIFLLHVFDTSNLKSAFELIDYFNNLAMKHPKLKDSITFNFVPTIPKNNEMVSCNKYIEGNEVLVNGIGVKAFFEATKKGFKIANFLNIGHCFRQAKYTLLISPDLDLFKCYGTFGNRKYAIANMKNISFDEYLILSKRISEADGFSRKCRDCDVVPFCRGGCQFSASEKNNGKYGFSNCEREAIVESINGFLKYKLFNY